MGNLQGELKVLMVEAVHYLPYLMYVFSIWACYQFYSQMIKQKSPKSRCIRRVNLLIKTYCSQYFISIADHYLFVKFILCLHLSFIMWLAHLFILLKCNINFSIFIKFAYFFRRNIIWQVTWWRISCNLLSIIVNISDLLLQSA